MSSSNLLVSVIIPTYRDWYRLSLCIEALVGQTYDKEYIEVLIVNNDPADIPPENFFLPNNFQLISEQKPGSYSARNAAILKSSGSILAFTDSDCIPSNAWIENGVKLLHQSTFKRIAGNIELFYKDPERLTIAEMYESVFAFKQQESAEQKGSAVTGNMITFRYVVDRVGLFNENLLSGGDHEWASRANLKGYKICFGPNVTISHPARSTIKELLKKTKRIGGGSATLHKTSKIKSLYKFIKSSKPPFEATYWLNKYGTHLNTLQKFLVFMVKYYINGVKAWEELRIAFGKSSRRE